jgi:hypothetical protein
MVQLLELYLCQIYLHQVFSARSLSFLLALLSEPKDGGSMSLLNVMDLYQNACHKVLNDSILYFVGSVYESNFNESQFNVVKSHLSHLPLLNRYLADCTVM